MIADYRDRRAVRDHMVKLIESVSHGVPKALTKIAMLGRT